jgi:Nickel responsive protein SCO4226-like
MPQYVIERDIPGGGQLTEDQIRELSVQSLAVLKTLGPEIHWVHSYVTDDRVYCVFFAHDEGQIREHARQLGVPANRVSAVRHLINPDKYN